MTAPRLDEGSEREAFEAFMSHSRRNRGVKKAAELLNKFEDGTYVNEHVQRHWWTWQQSRAALSTGRQGGAALVINATQLRSALELAAPDFDTDEDQREQEVVIQRLPARTSTEGEPMEAGLYCWLADYPEEGCIPLREDEAPPAPAAKPQGDSNVE